MSKFSAEIEVAAALASRGGLSVRQIAENAGTPRRDVVPE
jgi:hypothetical protein